jgi:hypothetical protein
MQRHYDEFDAKEAGWQRRTLVWWAVILATTVTAMLTLDAAITAEQRSALFQQSGIFP